MTIDTHVQNQRMLRCGSVETRIAPLWPAIAVLAKRASRAQSGRSDPTLDVRHGYGNRHWVTLGACSARLLGFKSLKGRRTLAIVLSPSLVPVPPLAPVPYGSFCRWSTTYIKASGTRPTSSRILTSSYLALEPQLAHSSAHHRKQHYIDMDAFFVIASPIQADEPTSSSVEEIEETFVDYESLNNSWHSGCVIA